MIFTEKEAAFEFAKLTDDQVYLVVPSKEQQVYVIADSWITSDVIKFLNKSGETVAYFTQIIFFGDVTK